MPRKKIVLVEDDQFLHSIMAKKLGEAQYDVVSVMDGSQVISTVEQNKPDIILLDVILPGVDGFELAKLLKSHQDPAIKQIPILILSNLGQKEDVEKANELGVEGYLVKANFTADEILTKVAALLDK